MKSVVICVSVVRTVRVSDASCSSCALLRREGIMEHGKFRTLEFREFRKNSLSGSICWSVST